MNRVEINLQTMKNVSIPPQQPAVLARSVALMKPITWFAPMWAFLCGAVASGADVWTPSLLGRLLIGILMAGPILCGMSQVLNDYFDREIDAVNEPHRLIPAGLVSITQVFITVFVLGVVGLSIAFYLGPGVLGLTMIGIVLATAYSAPPIRAKRNGLIGNGVVAISYEGLAWMAGHVAFASLTEASIVMAVLYSVGTHGIMSINDFKSLDGDRLSNIRTIPVLLGPVRAAWSIAITMNLAQLGVIIAFLSYGQFGYALLIALVMLVQIPLQRRFIQQPTEYYLKFSAIGVTFFVWGMLFSAVGIRAI